MNSNVVETQFCLLSPFAFFLFRFDFPDTRKATKWEKVIIVRLVISSLGSLYAYLCSQRTFHLQHPNFLCQFVC